MTIIWILALPALAAVVSLLPLGRRASAVSTVLAALLGMMLASLVVVQVASEGSLTAVAGWISCDGFDAVVLWLVSFVGLAGALASWGMMESLSPEPGSGALRRYYAGLNMFLLSLLAVPVLSNVAMVWIAVAFTTLFSAFLVSFTGTPEALEAAWKYLVLTSLGAVIALFGVFVLYWAGSAAGVEEFTWEALAAAAPGMPTVLLSTAFLFVLVGFGTKAGLVPMHTWLPDAYGEAPLPICVLLSGAEAGTVLYVILRFLPICSAAGVDVGGWAVGLGLLSTGFAVLFLLRASDIKRLLAFSTIEHMGIVLVAAGLGTSDATAGAVYQLAGHALAKSFCFLAVGMAALVAGTRQIDDLRGLLRSSPVVGVSLLVGALAIAGAPLSALFVSEMSIIRSGLDAGHYVVTGLLTLFIAVGFCAVMMRANRMVFGDKAPALNPREAPTGTLAAMALLAVPLLVSSVYLPPLAQQLLAAATSTLGGL